MLSNVTSNACKDGISVDVFRVYKLLRLLRQAYLLHEGVSGDYEELRDEGRPDNASEIRKNKSCSYL
jgi:hypothetical protein